MRFKKIFLCMLILCCLFLVGCTDKIDRDKTQTGGTGTQQSGPPSSENGEEETATEYTVCFRLSAEMDGSTLYLSVGGLSVPNEEAPHLHTIEPKTVEQGEALDFLKTPTILNDQSARYVFLRWEASDGKTAVTVTENTVLSETALKTGTVTVYPVLKKVTHTGNYS